MHCTGYVAEKQVHILISSKSSTMILSKEDKTAYLVYLTHNTRSRY